MTNDLAPLSTFRVIAGEGRPSLLVWNEGVLRTPAAAGQMAQGRGIRPTCASGLLSLFTSRVQHLFPELALEGGARDGVVRIDALPSDGASLALSRELALDMGLSVLCPRRCSYVSFCRPSPRICRSLIRMLHEGECDLIELSYDDVSLHVSRGADEAFVVMAETNDARAVRVMYSFGFSPVDAEHYRTVLGWGLEWSATLLQRQLDDLQRHNPALAAVLHPPRLRSVR